MDRVLQCDCGFEARAADEDGLVAEVHEVQRHAREAHGMALSYDEVLPLTFRDQLHATKQPATPLDPTARKGKEEE